MVGLPYDDLKGWRGPYPAATFVAQFDKVATAWHAGLPDLERAANLAPPERAADAQAELRFAHAAALHFRSVADQSRYVMTRDALAAAPTAADRQRLAAELREILRAEEASAKALYALASADSRIGFEASNHYYYVPQDLIEKVLNCRHLASADAGIVR